MARGGAALLALALNAWAEMAAAAPTVQLDPFGDNSVRVRIALPGCSITNPLYQGLLDAAPPLRDPTAPLERASDGLSITNGNINAAVDASTGFVTVTRVSDGRVLTAQNGLASWAPQPGNRPGVWSAQISFTGVAPDEVVRGFGEQQDDAIAKPLPFSRSVEHSEFHQETGGSQVLIPWFFTSSGWGMLLNLPSYGNLTVAAAPQTTTFFTEAAENIDLWFTTTPAGLNNATDSIYRPLLLQLADATGHGLPMAPFASGFIQCKDRYRNQSQVLDVARGYFERGIPISMLIIDWFHWKMIGDMSFNPSCWPDPQGMTDELRTMGIELAVTHWPFNNPASETYGDMNSSGWLAINRNSGKPDIFWDYLQGGALMDTTSQAASDYVFARWKRSYGDYGIRGVWLDETEPDRNGYTYGQWQLSAGADFEVGEGWRVSWLKMFADGFDSMQVPSTQRFVLSRSGWTGTQRYGHHVWSGDIGSDFGSLHNQLFAGQGFGLSGNAMWTTDT